VRVVPVRFFARHPVLRRTVALILTAISTAGCMTWRPAANDASYVTAQQPGRVRATLANGNRIDVFGAAVVDSQLVGITGTVGHSARVAIPVKQVVAIEVLRLDVARTLLLAGVVYLVANAGSLNVVPHLGGILPR